MVWVIAFNLKKYWKFIKNGFNIIVNKNDVIKSTHPLAFETVENVEWHLAQWTTIDAYDNWNWQIRRFVTVNAFKWKTI